MKGELVLRFCLCLDGEECTEELLENDVWKESSTKTCKFYCGN
jgi:hypothetical protein